MYVHHADALCLQQVLIKQLWKRIFSFLLCFDVLIFVCIMSKLIAGVDVELSGMLARPGAMLANELFPQLMNCMRDHKIIYEVSSAP